MKSSYLLLSTGLVALVIFIACTKNTNPTPPVTDTVTITKTDTLILPPPNDTPNLTNGLVLYLPFNGSFADSSGLGNTITPVNGAALGYDMHGYAQSAFTSSGNGAALLVSNNGAYAVDTAFSVSFDFMIRSNAYYYGGGNYSGLENFLSIVDNSNGNGPTFAVGLNIPGTPQYFNFGVNSSTSDCDSSGDDNPFNRDDTSKLIPQIGSWYNAICIFSHGTCSTYINGQLASSKTGYTDSVLFCPNANFIIGAWWGGTESLNGELDEVRFYNRTLNPKQIAWLSRNFQPNSISTKASPGIKSNNPSRF
jgi:Concanavalin A-like lectin/glucanases superfamily